MSLDISQWQSRLAFMDAQNRLRRIVAEAHNTTMIQLFGRIATVDGATAVLAAVEDAEAAALDLPGSRVVLPDIPARIAWISVNERMGYVIPKEIVRMIGEYVTYTMFSCAYVRCTAFFKEGRGHGKDQAFCSSDCADRFKKYDAYANAVHSGHMWNHGSPQGTVELNIRADINVFMDEVAKEEKEKCVTREKTMALLQGNCKVCKKKLVKTFKDTDCCSKACHKRRWKK